MPYWFENPTLKAIVPLALSTAMKGLNTIIRVPVIYAGFNVLPEGPVIGPSTIGAIAPRCPRKRAFLVTDEFNQRNAGKAAQFLQANGFSTELWPKTLPEVPLPNALECGVAMSRFEPDLIMGVGGGSVMDMAKAAWILYERPDIQDLAMISPLDPLNLRQKAILAAVPTTSGTGSECTGAAVLTDVEAHRKIPIANLELIPDVAILCPELTISMPPKLTAGTGLDVLAHAVDAATTPAANEFTEPLALKAVEMVFQWLPVAYKNGEDREARHRMMLAASLAGIAFGTSGCHLTHSLGHALGAVFGIHHGLAVGFFIPHSLQFCSKVTQRHLSICRTLGIASQDPAEGLKALSEKVWALFDDLGVPRTLEGFGIHSHDLEAQMPKLVKYAYEDVDTYFSPRPVTPLQCEKLFRYAHQGREVDF